MNDINWDVLEHKTLPLLRRELNPWLMDIAVLRLDEGDGFDVPFVFGLTFDPESNPPAELLSSAAQFCDTFWCKESSRDEKIEKLKGLIDCAREQADAYLRIRALNVVQHFHPEVVGMDLQRCQEDSFTVIKMYPRFSDDTPDDIRLDIANYLAATDLRKWVLENREHRSSKGESEDFEWFRGFVMLVFDASLDDLRFTGTYPGKRGVDYELEIVFKEQLCPHRMDYVRDWIFRMDDDQEDTPPECGADDLGLHRVCPECGQQNPVDWESTQEENAILLPLLRLKFPWIRKAEYRLAELGTRDGFCYELHIDPEPPEEEGDEIKRIMDLVTNKPFCTLSLDDKDGDRSSEVG